MEVVGGGKLHNWHLTVIDSLLLGTPVLSSTKTITSKSMTTKTVSVKKKQEKHQHIDSPATWQTTKDKDNKVNKDNVCEENKNNINMIHNPSLTAC